MLDTEAKHYSLRLQEREERKKKLMFRLCFGLMKYFFCEFLNQAVKVLTKPM